MIKEVSQKYNIDQIYADKAHYNRRSFNLLDHLNIKPMINIRNNSSSIKTKSCPLRRDEILLRQKLGCEGWKELKDAGKRWIAETVFFCIKIRFGEYVSAIKFENMVKENNDQNLVV